MSLTDLSSAQLERLVELVKERETLQDRINQVNQSLDALEKGDSSGPSKAAAPGRRRRRIGLKDALLQALKSTGKVGMTVKELAENLGAKAPRVSVWFYTTGKKTKGIKRVGRAKYAYVTG